MTTREPTSAALQPQAAPSRTYGRALFAALLASIVAIPVLLYLPFLSEPFEPDEGIYATIARGLLDGQLPYRDLFDHKPPVVYGWYALSFLLFGEHIEAPRLLAALLLSATTLLVFVEGRLLGSRAAGLVAAALFAGSTGVGVAVLQANANTEVFMLLPLTGALVCTTTALRRPAIDRGTLAWGFAAGGLASVAVLTKPVSVWNLLALAGLVAIWGLRGGRPRLRGLRPVAAFALGAGLVGVLIVTPWAVSGALDDFVYANVRYNTLYNAQLSYVQKLDRMLGGVSSFVLVAAPLLVVAWLGLRSLRRPWRWPLDHLLVVWAVASVIGVASPGRFFLHYFVQLLPALALLSVPLVERARRERWPSVVRPPVLALRVGLLIPLLAATLWLSLAVYLEPNAAARHEAKWVAEQAQADLQGPAIGAYLAARTTPEERIYNFGRDSQIYFYAGRQPATRFLYERVFWIDPPTLDEALATLLAAPPAYVVVTAGLDVPLPSLGVTTELHGRFYPPAFAAFLVDHYRFEGLVEYARVYALIDRQP